MVQIEKSNSNRHPIIEQLRREFDAQRETTLDVMRTTTNPETLMREVRKDMVAGDLFRASVGLPTFKQFVRGGNER